MHALEHSKNCNALDYMDFEKQTSICT